MNAKTRKTIGYFGTFFLLGAVISALGPTINGLAENVGQEAPQLSFLFSFRAVGYLSGALLGGVLYERIPGHKVLAGILLLMAGILFFTPVVDALALLIPFLIGTGLSCGAMDVGSNTMLAFTHKDSSGPYLNAMYLFAGIGSFLAPLYLGFVSLSWGYRGLALLVLPAALWMLITPSPTILSSDDGIQQAHFRPDILVLFMLLSFFTIGLEVSYSGWIYTYQQQLFPASTQMGYYLTSVFWAGITLGRLTAIPAAARLKAPRMIFTFLGGGLISTIMLIALAEVPWALWAGTAGVGLSLAALFPTAFGYIQRIANLTPRQNGLVWASGSTGSIVLPWLVGWQIGASGPRAMMVIQMLAWISALIIFAVLYLREMLDNRKQG